MAKEAVENTVETGISSRLQPWQAIFGILTYAIGVYGIENEKALILYGLILATLGFVQVSTYKHKEAIKQVVAPWLVEQLLKIVSEYLAPQLPGTPEEAKETPELVPELTKEERIAQLTARLKELTEV